MKKSLSLLLAIALVFSLFANAAFAAEQPSLNDKYQALVDEGVFTPYPDGDPRFDEETTRGQFAKIVTLVAGLEEIEGTYSFNDNNYTKHWARPYVEAVYAAGIMQGKDLNKMIFGVNDNITIEEMAKVLATILGLEEVENAPAKAGVSKWAYGWVKAVEDAGFALTTGAYNVPAKRSLLVEAAYQAWQALSVQVESVKIVDSKNIEVTFTDGEVVKVELDKALEPNKENVVKVNHNGKTYNVTVKLDKVLVDKVAQSGAKKIKVTFNRGLNADEKADLSYELKFGTITYSTKVTYAEDNASVELEANYLPSGDFTLNVKGFDPFTVKVEEGKVSKVEIGATSVSKAKDQDLKVKALNQFGEEVVGEVGVNNISVYGHKGQIDANSNSKYDMDDLDKDSTVVVTVYLPAHGLTASKSFKIVDPASATSITLGQVAPKDKETRIMVGHEGLILPYTLTDQYGQKITLSGNAQATGNSNIVTFGDIQFTSSDVDIVNPATLKADANGVLTFNVNNKAGVVIITVFNPKTGANASTTVKVEESSSKVGKFTISNPGVMVVAGEEVTFPYSALDIYGAPIENSNFAKAQYNGQIRITTGGGGAIDGAAKWTVKGDLKLKFTGKGQTFIFVQDQNGVLLSQLNVDVKEAAKPERIVGLKGLQTVFAKDGSATISVDNVDIIDNYGRSVTKLEGIYSLSATSSAPANVSVSGLTKLTGVTADKTATITIKLNGSNATGSEYKFDAKVVKDDEITSFEIKSIPTLYGYAANNDASNYAKAIEVVGKLADGKEVAIVQSNYVKHITSSQVEIADVVAGKVVGKAKGTATIAVWDGKGTKLNEVTVTVSDAAPYINAVSIEDGKAEITLAKNATKDLGKDLKVTDQYGVEIAKNGFWTTTNAGVVTVDQNGNIQAVGKDTETATITFVAANGTSDSILVYVGVE